MTQFYIDDQSPHLGGYIVGGDDATYYPELWEWLVKECGVRSVLDVGCGEGHALRFFRELGCRTMGIDGIEQNQVDILTHDYTESGLELDPFDLVWSCEFVEHVEEQYVPNFLRTFKAAKIVTMTHAEPGQPGWHHVNCQTADYWRGAMTACGYSLDLSLTKKTRELALLSNNPINHYARSGLAFVREVRNSS